MSQRLLPPEFVAINLPKPKLAPQESFRFGRVVAKCASALPYSIRTPYPSLSPQGGKEPISVDTETTACGSFDLRFVAHLTTPPNVSFSFT